MQMYIYYHIVKMTVYDDFKLDFFISFVLPILLYLAFYVKKSIRDKVDKLMDHFFDFFPEDFNLIFHVFIVIYYVIIMLIVVFFAIIFVKSNLECSLWTQSNIFIKNITTTDTSCYYYHNINNNLPQKIIDMANKNCYYHNITYSYFDNEGYEYSQIKEFVSTLNNRTTYNEMIIHFISLFNPTNPSENLDYNGFCKMCEYPKCTTSKKHEDVYLVYKIFLNIFIYIQYSIFFCELYLLIKSFFGKKSENKKELDNKKETDNKKELDNKKKRIMKKNIIIKKN